MTFMTPEEWKEIRRTRFQPVITMAVPVHGAQHVEYFAKTEEMKSLVRDNDWGVMFNTTLEN